MPLPQRLHAQLKRLSPRELKELQASLKRLIRQKEQNSAEERLPGKTGAAKRHYTYRREYVKCGKPGCQCATGRGHGPYWYAYWKENGRLKKRYIGKKRP